MRRFDKTKLHSKENRALDTVARYLTGDSTCVAVTLFNNKLIISSNKLSPANAKKFNKYFKGEIATPDFPKRDTSSLKLKEALEVLSDPSNFLDTIYKNVSNVFFGRNSLEKGNLLETVMGNIIKLVKDDIPKQKLSMFIKKQIASNASYNDFVDIRECVAQGVLNPDNLIDEGWDGEVEKDEKKILKNFSHHLSRINHDIKKLLRITSDKNPLLDLKQALKSKSFEFVVTPKVGDNSNKESHAEANIADYLLNRNLPGLICQQFSGQIIKHIFVILRILLAIGSH